MRLFGVDFPLSLHIVVNFVEVKLQLLMLIQAFSLQFHHIIKASFSVFLIKENNGSLTELGCKCGLIIAASLYVNHISQALLRSYKKSSFIYSDLTN